MDKSLYEENGNCKWIPSQFLMGANFPLNVFSWVALPLLQLPCCYSPALDKMKNVFHRFQREKVSEIMNLGLGLALLGSHFKNLTQSMKFATQNPPFLQIFSHSSPLNLYAQSAFS